MIKPLHYLLTGLILFVLAGCRENKVPLSADIKPENVVIHPYGKALFSLDPLNPGQPLRALTKEYGFFLGNSLDTVQILQIREFIMDPLNRDLAENCKQAYPDMKFLEEGLGQVFARGKLAIPGFESPSVYTYISGLLYEMPVQYIDSVLIIGLDMYLGRNFEPYRAIGIPMFMSRRMESQNILPECARQIAISLIPPGTNPKTLLDYMVLEGKVLYAMDMLLPPTPDSLKIGYTSDQYEWITDNEKSVWRMMIDQDLLYSSDPQVTRKFIQDGPFTAGMPEGAPAMLGKWIGWQIVRNYMQKNEETNLTGLFNSTDSQIILSKSGYKPKK